MPTYRYTGFVKNPQPPNGSFSETFDAADDDAARRFTQNLHKGVETYKVFLARIDVKEQVTYIPL